MKKLLLAAVVVFAITLGSVSLAPAWLVTVTNDAPYSANVDLYVNLFFFNHSWDSLIIFSGETYTFDTKGWCPSGFAGWVKNYHDTTLKLAETSILGHEIGVFGFSAGCWNSSWKICRKRGDEGYIANRDYGFCKQ